MQLAYTEYTEHLKILKNNGFNPKLVIDIGISNGEFFYECQKIFNSAQYLLFEARKESETEIEKVLPEVTVKYTKYFDTLLGDGWKDNVPFYQIDAGSSIYKENTKFPSQTVYKNVRPLDMYLIDKFNENTGIPFPIFMKIDTQGAELDILRGAVTHLPLIEVVQLEVALQEYNIGAPGVFEVHEFMNKFGFKLYDLGSAFRKESNGTLFHMDWIFVAKRSKLWQDRGYFWLGELKYE